MLAIVKLSEVWKQVQVEKAFYLIPVKNFLGHPVKVEAVQLALKNRYERKVVEAIVINPENQ